VRQVLATVSGPSGEAMSPNIKTKADDTRARIIQTAEKLFRRMGYTKIAVADIAGELRMSPANIYRFFDSKNAIVNAICQRCLLEVEEKAWTVARSKASAAGRLEKLILEILAYHKENFVADQHVAELVKAAIESNWNAIKAHKGVTHHVLELVLRDGIDSGEFEPLDPRKTAELMIRSLIAFVHPLLVGECMEEGEDIEAQARASVRFLLRAVTPRR
jgi:AcrR family transcriptional regulator